MSKRRRVKRLVNRYAQSRLYDVTTATYVDRDRLREWRAEGFDVVVRDVESGRYVTDTVLPSGFDA